MTMTDGEKLAYLGTDTVRWAEALVDRFDIQTDDIGEVYTWTANMIVAGRDAGAVTGWADWFESNSSHVGGKPVFTADEVAALLRGPKPFGIAASSEVGTDGRA